MATLLEIVTDVAAESGVRAPLTVISNTDDDARRFLALANGEVRRLGKRHDWQDLKIEGSITAVGAEDQGVITTIVGDDFLRFVDQTITNRTQNRRIRGTISSAEYQQEKLRATAGFTDQFIIRRGRLLIIPAPAVNDSIFFEYISNQSVLATNGTTYKNGFTVDTDTPVLDDDLVRLGMLWRLQAALGLDARAARAEYEDQVAISIGNDTPSKIILVGVPDHEELLLTVNVPNGVIL